MQPEAEPNSVTVTYSATTESFPNPERGFFHPTWDDTIFSSYKPLELSALRTYRENEDMAVIFRAYNLMDFVDSVVPQAYLSMMQDDFDTLRAAGLKAIIRFTYTNEAPGSLPYGDAPKDRVLAHIDQVKPVLHANSDVIAVLQAGFIGIWGEWYFTDHFANPDRPWELTEQHYADRKEILSALLTAVPTDRMVQLRYIEYKQRMYDTETGAESALQATQAHTGTNLARTAFHNDCFLVDETDAGTYDSNNIEADRAYLAAETHYVAMAGETCGAGEPNIVEAESIQRIQCPTALQQLAQFHWSMLNRDWNKEVLDHWRTGVDPHSCFDEVKRRLGYRFSLLQGTYSDTVKPGGDFSVDIELRNEGWAAPFNPRLVELVFRNTDSGQMFSATLDKDPRFWLASDTETYRLAHTICAPVDMPTGSYEVLLNLPDPEPSLYGRPEYSIRLANQDTWEADTGFNRLFHTLSVTSSAPAIACSDGAHTLRSKAPTKISASLPPIPGRGLVLASYGSVTGVGEEVVSGSYSIKGSYSGDGEYSPYLLTSSDTLPLIAGHTYRLTFDYRILTTPDRGFDSLFYSVKGGNDENWLPSNVITGEAGETGSATLTNTLLDYTDYVVRWNIVGTGAIAIDNISLVDVTTEETVASENLDD